MRIPARMRTLSLALFSLALVACDSGGGGDGGGGNGGNGGGDNGETDPVVQALEDAADPRAAELGRALAQCGAQSHNTTPDDWGEVAIDAGDSVCSVWTPAHWTNLRFGLMNIVYDEQDDANSVTLAGGVPTEAIVCTPAGVRDWALGVIEQGGCANARRTWGVEMNIDVVGVAVPSELFVVACERNGATQVGAYVAQVHGTSPLCSLRVDGYMMGEDQIAANVCTQSQIINSLKCLEKVQQDFACTKPRCSNQMKAQGHLGGFCNSFDECVPVE